MAVPMRVRGLRGVKAKITNPAQASTRKIENYGTLRKDREFRILMGAPRIAGRGCLLANPFAWEYAACTCLIKENPTVKVVELE